MTSSRRLPSLIGQRFDRLLVIRELDQGPRYERRYLCRCDCGTERSVLQMHLRHGRAKSCGCLGRERNAAARTYRLEGQRFGRLLVLRESGRLRKQVTWECRCDCGTVVVAPSYELRTGGKLSCGCLRIDAVKAFATTHGESKSVEYRIWVGMKNRCYNDRLKTWSDYGGRGITVCDRWKHSFRSFLADMGRRPSPYHSIDRRDNDGPYAPDNCRWVLPDVQRTNTRRSHSVTAWGSTLTLSQWAELSGVNQRKISRRLSRDWSPERAISE